MDPSVFIGTSGWSYPAFKTSLYQDVPRSRWLETYAQHFRAVEINATYYRLQSRETFWAWHRQTPETFRFAIKANRYVTQRRLVEPLDSIAIERDAASALGNKLSAVLWQLPPTFRLDLTRLERFCRALDSWPAVAHVIEFRDRSWFTGNVAACLNQHRIANCISDAASWPCWDAVTSNVAYVRLHGHTRTYRSRYTTRSLQSWANRVGQWRDKGHTVHVYFDNTDDGAAVVNAEQLQTLLEPRQSGRVSMPASRGTPRQKL